MFFDWHEETSKGQSKSTNGFSVGILLVQKSEKNTLAVVGQWVHRQPEQESVLGWIPWPGWQVQSPGAAN